MYLYIKINKKWVTLTLPKHGKLFNFYKKEC